MFRYFDCLHNLYNASPRLQSNRDSKYIIISDLHIGTRRLRDDFLPNSSMVLELLREYYYPQGYTLILNGDVEELQKKRINKITSRWADLYKIFETYKNDGRFYKIWGNHDIALLRKPGPAEANKKLYEGLVLSFAEGDFFVFHGHQASHFTGALNTVIGFFLKYLANPFGVKNFVRDYGNLKIHKTEKSVYEFSKKLGVVSIIGHTHRPLFESLSDIDIIMFTIEGLLRKIVKSSGEQYRGLEKEISMYREQLQRIVESDSMEGAIGSLYNKEMIIPAIFNSGAAIGPKGAHCIEISDNVISLVRWSSRQQKERFFSADEVEEVTGLKDKPFRKELKSDTLKYIFTRMQLLGKT